MNTNPLERARTPTRPTTSSPQPSTAAAAPAEASTGSFGDQLWSVLRLGGQPPRPPTRGLPIARLFSPERDSSAYYVVTTIDGRGRLADRSPLRILQWRPGLPVAVSVVRHACHFKAGDRLLMAACPDRGLLVAYPMSALDAMVLAYHATLVSEASP